MSRDSNRGFTLVEVLVALMIVALGLAALMVTVSGTARTSGYLRDKTLAQWIALNRLSEVRLTVNKLAQSSTNGDAGELDFANRTWHYDTRYFNTSVASMKRVVVRVWEGNAKTKGNPVAEFSSFVGSALSTPGGSNIDWTVGDTLGTALQPCTAGGVAGTTPGAVGTSATATTTTTTTAAPCIPTTNTTAQPGGITPTPNPTGQVVPQ
jgi:general secretion pathway protein I